MVSNGMKCPLPEFPVDNWIKKSVEMWHVTNLGEDEVEDVIWFMSAGAA